MIQEMLGAKTNYQVFDAMTGQMPADPAACKGYVITGSSAGVYEDLPWIPVLTKFLQAAKGRAKLVGICFGHQIMAQAFGGAVTRSETGLAIGLHQYTMADTAPWVEDPAPISIAVSHQDQVVVPPPGARVLGGSSFTPYGVLAYDDQPAISFQCHPEFGPDFAAALIEHGRSNLPHPEAADVWLASLSQPNDRKRVGRWIQRFLGVD